MYNFFDEFQRELLNDTNDTREIIFYFYDEIFSPMILQMELKALPENPRVFIIIGCWLVYRRFVHRKHGISRFPELAWIPVNRIVLLSAGNHLRLRERRYGTLPLQLPICYQSLLGLLKNPDFNRFEYHATTLLPGEEFPTYVNNLTVYFMSNLIGDNAIHEDSDALLQMMLFLKNKRCSPLEIFTNDRS